MKSGNLRGWCLLVAGASVTLAVTVESLSYAHFGRTPVSQTGAIANMTSANHAGYGYLLKTSEAEADNAVNFPCTDDDRRSYARAACRLPSGTDVTMASVATLAANVASGQTLQKMRDKVFEYLTLQMAGSNTTYPQPRPIPLARPACVTSPAADDNWDLTQNLIANQMPDSAFIIMENTVIGAMPTGTPTERLARRRAERERDDHVKYMSVANSFTTDNMVQAIMLHEQLRNAQTTNNCSTVTAASPATRRLLCIDVNEQLDRLRVSYPVLFEGNTASYAAAPASTRTAETTRISDLRNDVWELLGANGAPAAMTSQAALRTRGRNTAWNPRVNSSAWDAAQNLTTDYFAAATGARDGFCGAAPKTTSNTCAAPTHQPRMDAAYARLQATAARLRTEAQGRLTLQATGLCDASMNLEQLGKKYPSVLRQMLLEQSGPELAASKTAICGTPALADQLRQGVRDSCIGVTGSLSSPGGVRVHRTTSSFPFSSDPNYTVTQGADGRLTVNLVMNFSNTGTPAMPAATYQQTINDWVTNTTARYNSQANGLAPPLDPRVTFNITGVTGTADPHVNVSQCYNRSMPAGQEHSCTAIAAQKGGNNWEDSGNLTTTTDQNTLTHEFGHNMGLDDEYEALYYPMNTLGEHDSVMASGAQLYRRHFEQIVRPARRCGAGGTP